MRVAGTIGIGIASASLRSQAAEILQFPGIRQAVAIGVRQGDLLEGHPVENRAVIGISRGRDPVAVELNVQSVVGGHKDPRHDGPARFIVRAAVHQRRIEFIQHHRALGLDVVGPVRAAGLRDQQLQFVDLADHQVRQI